MKSIITIVLLLFAIAGFSQTDTIHIKRRPTNFGWKVNADSVTNSGYQSRGRAKDDSAKMMVLINANNPALKLNISDTAAMQANEIRSGSIAWPGTIYSTPTTGVVSGHAITYSPSLASQSAFTLLGRGSGSGTPSFLASIDSNWIPTLHSKAYYDGLYVPYSQTANRVMVSNGSGVVGTSSNLVWDATNTRLGIGVTPTYALDIVTAGTNYLQVLGNGVSSTNGFIKITNSTGTAGVMSPIFWTKGTGNGNPNLWFIGDNGAADAGTTAAIRLEGRQSNAAITNRPVLAVGNFSTDLLTISALGKITLSSTNTPAGTTGAQTINRSDGSVNFAAGAQTLVVTNSTVTASSHVLCQIETDDATAKSCITIISPGSCTIKLNAAATAETKVSFWVRD